MPDGDYARTLPVGDSAGGRFRSWRSAVGPSAMIVVTTKSTKN